MVVNYLLKKLSWKYNPTSLHQVLWKNTIQFDTRGLLKSQQCCILYRLLLFNVTLGEVNKCLGAYYGCSLHKPLQSGEWSSTYFLFSNGAWWSQSHEFSLILSFAINWPCSLLNENKTSMFCSKLFPSKASSLKDHWHIKQFCLYFIR